MDRPITDDVSFQHIELKKELGENEVNVNSVLGCKHPYALFSKEEWPKVREVFPGYGFKQITREIGRRWTELDQETKNEYRSRIKAAKQVNYLNYPAEEITVKEEIIEDVQDQDTSFDDSDQDEESNKEIGINTENFLEEPKKEMDIDMEKVYEESRKEIYIKTENMDEESNSEFEGDCSDFCSVQVKVEDTELTLQPENTSDNEDESYEALAEKDAEVCSVVSCKSPYILFNKEEWPRVRDEFPRYRFKEISQEVSRRWAELNEEAKNEYKSRIQAAKEVYNPEFEGNCSDFCSVQVKEEDTELTLQPENTSENEDESYEALAEKDAEVCSLVSCKSPYALFSKEEWPKVEDAFPEYGFKEITQEISRRWAELNEGAKNEYTSRIRAAKEVYYPSTIEKDADLRYIVSCKQPWTLFCKEEWPKVKALYPHFEFRDISKEVGRRWTVLDTASKKEYKARIEAAKAMYSPLMAERDAELRSLCKHPYSLFSKEQWHKVKAENPGFGFKEVSKEISNRWSLLDEGVKNEYRLRVEEAKARFNQVFDQVSHVENSTVQPMAMERENPFVGSLWPESPFGILPQIPHPFLHPGFGLPQLPNPFLLRELGLLQVPNPLLRPEFRPQACNPFPEFGEPSRGMKSFQQTELEASNSNHTVQVDRGKISLVPEQFYRQKKPVFPVYQCDKCDQKFMKKISLKDHIRIVHSQPPVKMYHCDKCSQRFSKRVSLRNHVRDSHPKITEVCKHCKEPFSTKKDMMEHIREMHPKEPWECPECGVLFPVKMMLVDHIRFTHPKRFTCNECDKVYTTEQSLLIHQITHTDNTPEYVKVRNMLVKKDFDCADCGSYFKSKHLLARHKISAHMFPKGYKCEECNKIFKKKKQFFGHQIVSHSAPRYECVKCDKKFVKKKFFTRHNRVAHRKGANVLV